MNNQSNIEFPTLKERDGNGDIDMLGACQGCPLSIATLKSGIERILIDKVPGVVEVIAT